VWGIVWGSEITGFLFNLKNPDHQSMKRFKTDYPGVYYIMGISPATGKQERIYYIRYRKNGKLIEDKAGRQIEDAMTPARAALKRSEKISGKIPTNQEERDHKRAERDPENGRWTIDKLWDEYKKQRKPGKGLDVDAYRYDKFLKDAFGGKEPSDFVALDIDRIRLKLQKIKSAQTVKHILNLLTWIINFGVKKGLCTGLSFRIHKPTVDNIKTEDLTPDQLQKLLKAIEEDEDKDVGNLMKLALFSGMRRGELFKLQWRDIDFDRGFITIRGPKGVKNQTIPLSDAARNVLNDQKRTQSPYVFPDEKGNKRVNVSKTVNRIKKAAALPQDFRPLHGLRHVYASMLASSGQVDMYTLQKLLTHKDPKMTQRYAHLRDETLKKASNLAGEIVGNINQSTKSKKLSKK
jgi:integrase